MTEDRCTCPRPSTCEYCSRMYPCDCQGCPYRKKRRRVDIHTTRVGRILLVHTSACAVLAYAFLTKGDDDRDSHGYDIGQAFLIDGTPIDLDPILITK